MLGQADVDRSGHGVHHKVGERNVLEARAWPALHLDRAAVGLVDHAVRHSDVPRAAAAETKHRPARAEDAVRYRDELTTAKQRARVVLAKHGAIADMDVATA